MKLYIRKMFILMFAMTLVIVGIGSSNASVEAAAAKPIATYISPESISFISYSKSWDQAKLKALYKELMKNLHGEELAYLGKVILSAENKEGELGVASMNYQWTEDDQSDITMEKGTEITLYNANSYTTVESMSSTLSHEYGHHFTHYWIIKKEHKLPSNPTIKWAGIRSIKGSPVLFTEDTSDPDYTHYWDAAEIMADDYMVLFGSPTAKLAMAKSIGKEDSFGFYQEVENEEIASVMTLPAVRAYWLKLSGLKDPLPLVFKEPKLTNVQAIKAKNGGIDHKITFSAGSSDAAVAKRLQYIVYWMETSEEEQYVDYSVLTTGKLSVVIPGGLPETELMLTIYAYDPKTKQYVYARPVYYDLSKSTAPMKMAS